MLASADGRGSAEAALSGGNSNLFIGDINKDCTENQLLELFSTVGEVLMVSIKRSKATNKPLGYGFVKMASAWAAGLAMDTLQGTPIGGRPIRIGWGEVDCCCRIENLAADVTEDQLHELFSAFGPLQFSRTDIQKTGKPHATNIINDFYSVPRNREWRISNYPFCIKRKCRSSEGRNAWAPISGSSPTGRVVQASQGQSLCCWCRKELSCSEEKARCNHKRG